MASLHHHGRSSSARIHPCCSSTTLVLAPHPRVLNPDAPNAGDATMSSSLLAQLAATGQPYDHLVTPAVHARLQTYPAWKTAAEGAAADAPASEGAVSRAASAGPSPVVTGPSPVVAAAAAVAGLGLDEPSPTSTSRAKRTASTASVGSAGDVAGAEAAGAGAGAGAGASAGAGAAAASRKNQSNKNPV